MHSNDAIWYKGLEVVGLKSRERLIRKKINCNMYTNIQLKLLVPCYTRSFRNSFFLRNSRFETLEPNSKKKNLNRRRNGINAGVKFFLEQTF